MSQFDPKTEKYEPPAEVKEVAQYLWAYCVFCGILGVFCTVISIPPYSSVDTCILSAGIGLIGVGILDGICAYSFYHLKPWSYLVVRFLLLFHRADWGLRIRKEDGDRIIREAFDRRWESDKEKRHP